MTERPYVWQMVREAIQHLGGPVGYTEIRDYIQRRYGEVNERTIRCMIICCTVNHSSRAYYQSRMSGGQYDLLYQTARGIVEPYDPAKHGVWELRPNAKGELKPVRVEVRSSIQALSRDGLDSHAVAADWGRAVTVGPATHGSRYCLQQWVEFRRDDLSDQIVAASSSLTAFAPLRVEWRSPLAQDYYREYGDDFLRVLGFPQHEAELRRFWPRGGPQWEGLAVLTSEQGRGILLVEAKAHPGETASSCGATEANSLATIRAAFAQTQAALGVAPRDWLTGSCQLANRLAFLYFLNEVVRVPAWLALVNFVDDRSHKPTTLAEWRQHQQQLFTGLGLQPGCRLLDRVIAIYPEAAPREGADSP